MRMLKKWPTKELGEVLDYEQPGKYIVSSKNYSSEYQTPVLTAGKTFILGNTNEKDYIFPVEKLPVIIFDDFTTAIKFVDFPFKVKSSAMKILHVKRSVADAKYAFYAMQTKSLNHATHKRYWISEYSKIEIPLPPIEEQKRIVAKLENLLGKVKEAKRLRTEAQATTANLLPAALHKIFSEGKQKGWEEQLLAEVAEINPKKSEVKDEVDETLVSFVPMSSVNEYSQTIATSDERRLGEVRKGYTYFKENDVLLAKITPCFENGKIAIAKELKNGIGFGTTEFHVIRAGKDILSAWIYNVLRQPFFRDKGKTRMTGSAGQKRVPTQFLESYQILVPPLAEQKKIVAHLDSLSEKIRQLQEHQIQTATDLDQLEKSILHQAFAGEL